MFGDVQCLSWKQNCKMTRNFPSVIVGHVRGSFSDEHSTLVATVRNLKIGYISPQYHIVFDDLFETKFHRGQNNPVIDQICNDLFDYIRDWYAEEEYDPEGQLIYRPPPLADVWLDEPVCRERK